MPRWRENDLQTEDARRGTDESRHPRPGIHGWSDTTLRSRCPEAHTTDLCEQRGWEHELYEDAGISGETVEARPAMMRLLRDAGEGSFDKRAVIVMVRLSRSTDMLD